MKDVVKTVLIVAAVVLAVVSLSLNIIVLVGMRNFQIAGLQAIATARTGLVGVSDFVIDTTVPIQQTFPIYAEVPLEQEFSVPIQTEIPISTVVEVPIQIPVLGTRVIEVPVDTSVPIDLQVVIPVSQTVSVDTSVTLDTEVPVNLELEDLGLNEILDQVDAALQLLEDGLSWPLGSAE
jgi:hypothetical protein